MRSQLDERLGVLVPQIVALPDDVHSLAAAQEAIDLANAYGLAHGHPLDESQEFTLRAGLGERADGSWAAATMCDFEPRQNGKNDTCGARELAGLRLFGEQLILHTAHEFKTANESFLRMVSLFENWDDLRKLVARIRYANGEQGIEFLSGQRLKYLPRTGGAGRGFAEADLVVYDEGQHLVGEHLAASAPTKLANRNAQSWIMGSGGLSTSTNAWRHRRKALAGGGGRFAYVEHTAEVVSLREGRFVSVRPDVLDRDAWAAANPAYGRRITDEALESVYDDLGPDLFARECLCVWDAEPGQGGGPFDPALWQSLGDASHVPTGPLRYALDVDENAKGETWSTVAVSDGTHVEVVKSAAGTGWVVPACVEKLAGGELVVAKDGPAGALVADLEAAGVRVRLVKPDEFTQASMQFLDAVLAGIVRHIDQAGLNVAVGGVQQRDVGDGQWRWSRNRSTVDIGPLCAVTLARWAATQTPPVVSGFYYPYEDDEWEDDDE